MDRISPARLRNAGLFVVAVAVLYGVVSQPQRSAECVELVFGGVAEAVRGVGDLATDPLP
ncbi:hypothetical protein [Streptomyces sp. RFCAC02]|uniref:hypothetical protein n=1 Tax=Streptomyces sp. RFCAC02 TaxID=2499143 RepID=UPI0010220B8B|nr:hypothetical protein [Streptomyces sp. RFCAC02]